MTQSIVVEEFEKY